MESSGVSAKMVSDSECPLSVSVLLRYTNNTMYSEYLTAYGWRRFVYLDKSTHVHCSAFHMHKASANNVLEDARQANNGLRLLAIILDIGLSA